MEKEINSNEPVLFIAFHFPPKGGPAVQRTLRFVEELPQNGYLPKVLTIRTEDLIKMNDLMDESLLARIPSEVEVIRVKSCIPFGFIKFTRRLRLYRFFWFLFYPLFWELSSLWPFCAYKKAKQIIKTNKIKIVYTTSGPFSSLLLGYLLKKMLKVRWVADLRDPFTDAYAWKFPTKLHWYFSRFVERKLIQSADKIIVNTPEVRKLFLAYKVYNPEKIITITNGY